jgi:hypothetical protein
MTVRLRYYYFGKLFVIQWPNVYAEYRVLPGLSHSSRETRATFRKLTTSFEKKPSTFFSKNIMERLNNDKQESR